MASMQPISERRLTAGTTYSWFLSNYSDALDRLHTIRLSESLSPLQTGCRLRVTNDAFGRLMVVGRRQLANTQETRNDNERNGSLRADKQRLCTLIARGTSLREALKCARKIGCQVDYPNRTGEVRVTTPDGRRSRINGRRKDATLRLLTLMRQTMRSMSS